MTFSFYAIALGKDVDIATLVFMIVGLFIVIVGNYLPKTKQSYTMGIKISWTLNSEENWNRTHHMAGWLYTVGGLLIIADAFLKWVWLFVTICFVMVIVPVVYSFALYKKGI